MSSVITHQLTPQTSSFTCNTCSIRFIKADLQRQHMKTEWHRYNLKRRVAQLPSISSDVFADKVLNQEQLGSEIRRNEDEDGFYVHYRKVKNNTNKLLTKHLAEKKRLAGDAARGRAVKPTEINEEFDLSRAASPVSIASEFSQFSLGDNSTVHESESGSEINYSDSDFVGVEAELEDESDSDGVVSDADSLEDVVAIPITHCFYCGIDNHEVEPNLKHMFKHHGLYIPERTYVSDLTGLLLYLSEAISLYHHCLVCGFQGKNLLSIRQHIYSKGHCKLPYETKEEKLVVAEFYDFTDLSSHSSTTKSASKKKVNFSEETEDAEAAPEEDFGDDRSEQYGINDNYTLVKVDKSGVELTLPTGSRIGHRSMTRYYRQNLTSKIDPKDSAKTLALVDRRFAPGMTSHEVTKQEKQTRRLEQKLKNYDVNRSKSYRANFQKHFVDEMLGHA